VLGTQWPYYNFKQEWLLLEISPENTYELAGFTMNFNRYSRPQEQCIWAADTPNPSAPPFTAVSEQLGRQGLL
jgi:hypothetical protein